MLQSRCILPTWRDSAPAYAEPVNSERPRRKGEPSKFLDPYIPHLTEKDVLEFKAIHEKHYEEEITLTEAWAMAHRLLALYSILRRPLPHELKQRASERPPNEESPPRAS